MSDQPTRIVRPNLEYREEPRPARRDGFIRRWFRRLVKLGLVCALLGLAVLGISYWYFVVEHPGEHLERDHILQLISQEAPVFYRDGETRLGVFFSEEHRRYVPFDSIPRHFVDALVSAEDQDFWSHPGFSVRGISRAFLDNLRAGRVVAGGSTLTQQTAKNLYKREGRTYKEKLRELANGLRLERLYSKEDILEFYTNQFYVNGNGRGLPIAARFFFDKELDELELVECAFLAGVVKSPNRYNPWVPGEERQQRALRAARVRTDYVLGRMLEEGTITAAEHAEATGEPIPFSRGHFRFERSVVLDEVERELTRPSFQRLLHQHGIDDLGTSGLRVTTTLDAGIQEGAHYALRHHLTELGVLLEAPELDALFGEEESLRPLDPDAVRPGLFHRALLVGVDLEARTAAVDLGGVEGVLDPDANLRLATSWKRAGARNTWARASRAEVSELLASIEPFVGRSLLVSIREVDEAGVPLLDWEFGAELEGAVLVLEDGTVRGMVGGSRNADFNRSTMARRQLGSTWKPVLFEAALQLRWSSTDPLDNRRGAFPYQSWFYYPRPDHRGAPEQVSMAWAAAMSENLASIWLLYHLTDQLNPEQFRQVATTVDLVPRAGEERSDFVRRVQKAGVIPTGPRLLEGLFDRVKADLEVDLAFDGRDGEAEALAGLHYGLGFAEAMEEVRADEELNDSERSARLGALERNLLRQEALAERFSEARAQLLARVAEGLPLDDGDLAGFSVRTGPEQRVVVSYGDRSPEGFEPLSPRLLATLSEAAVALPPSAEDALPDPLGEPEDAPGVAPSEGSAVPPPAEPAVEPDDVDRMFAPEPPDSPQAPRAWDITRLLDPGAVLLEGQLSPAVVRRVRAAIEAARAELPEEPDLYSVENLPLCRDYRTLAGIRYVSALAERSGVQSPIDPVMSLPLGSSDITLLEAARLYQVMMTGETYRFYPDPLALDATLAADVSTGDEAAWQEPYDARRVSPFPETAIIWEIALPDGRIVYQAARDEEPVQGAGVSGDLGGMLRRVVSHGTGRRAEAKIGPTSEEPARAAELRSFGVRLPLFGKTGTTNSYKNSAFVGMVPGLPEDGDRLRWGEGHVIATYVGYDDNREMRRGGIRIAGSSGSLPVWMGAAAAVVAGGDIGDRVDLADLAFSGGSTLGLDWPEGSVPITVDARTGLPVVELDPESSQAPGSTAVLSRRAEERSFQPFQPREEASEP